MGVEYRQRVEPKIGKIIGGIKISDCNDMTMEDLLVKLPRSGSVQHLVCRELSWEYIIFCRYGCNLSLLAITNWGLFLFRISVDINDYILCDPIDEKPLDFLDMHDN